MKRLAIALLCASILIPTAVYAADQVEPVAVATDAGALIGSKVTIPWGAYVSAALSWSVQFIVAIAVALAAWAGRELPSWIASLIQENLTQKRIERAVNYAVTQVNGKIGGMTLDVSAANGLVAYAEQYMLRLAPQAAQQLGDRLKPMILAQIAKIGAAPAAPLPAPLPATPLPQLRK